MVFNGVTFPEAFLAEFCARHGILRLSLFGSTLSGTANASSDIDLLVEFQPDQRPTLFSLSQMERELIAILGRDVDLRTPLDLSPKFRQDVILRARLLHAA